MRYYATIDVNGICTGFQVSGKGDQPANTVEITKEQYVSQDLLYRKYENGQWSVEKYPPPEPPQQETVEEKLVRLEQRLQETTLIQYEALATIFEEILALREEINTGGA